MNTDNTDASNTDAGNTGDSWQAAASLIDELTSKARTAQTSLGQSSHKARCNALLQIAAELRAETNQILAANQLDLANANNKGLSDAFIDRLTLTPDRIEAMAVGVEAIAGLPDPLGKSLARWTVPSGLEIERVSTALGVIGIIYESRPNVTIDAGALCLKSGNAAILRGGSDSLHSSLTLTNIMQNSLVQTGLADSCIQMIPTPDRTAVTALLRASGKVDVIVPRAGNRW